MCRTTILKGLGATCPQCTGCAECNVSLPPVDNKTVLEKQLPDVVATAACKPRAPWTVAPSSNFQGRYFFYNTDTNASCWTLSADYFEEEKAREPPCELLPDIIQPPINKKQVESRGAGPRSWSSPTFGTTKSLKPATSSPALLPDIHANAELQRRNAWSEKTDSDTTLTNLTDGKFSVLEGLGKGGYATVVKVEHTLSKKHFAMKVVLKNISAKKSQRLEHKSQLENELKIMTEVTPHPFLQRCHLAFEDSAACYFVLDLNGGGDLFYQLLTRAAEHGEAGFLEQECVTILSEVFLALEHLHAHNFVHRDIKIENIMLDSQGHVKVVDFGLAVKVKSKFVNKMDPLGSLIYMAPELVKDKTGGRHTDWWALGVLAYELLTGNTPWSSLTDVCLIKHEILHVSVDFESAKISPKAATFISSLMCRDMARRLGSRQDSDIRKCKFFESVDWEKTSRCDAAPAFQVQPNNINFIKDVQHKSLQAYKDIRKQRSNLQSAVAEKNTWSLGLESSARYL